MIVYLSLGSNVGDRAANLQAALDALRCCDGIEMVAVSSGYETAPVGNVNQPDFINLAAEIETELEPLELLNAVKKIEKDVGRIPTTRWGQRVIDIDILLWEDKIVDTELLTIPHREMRHRAFVLNPMAEIAPERIDPITGSSMAELCARPDVEGRVVRIHTRFH